MRFSIIMSTWNRATFIKKAIESVLAQDFKDYELLIIDDGSTDNTEKVVSPYLSENIIYHKIPHSGVSAARNFGLRNAKGNCIAYLDTDNTWRPNFLSTMNNALSDKKVAYCKYDLYMMDRVTGRLFYERTVGIPFNFRKVLNEFHIDLNAFVHAKECIRYIGYFDENLKRLVDYDFFIRIFAKYEPIFVPEILVDYYYNVALNTITYNNTMEEPMKIIDRKKQQYPKDVSLSFDAIKYNWDNVSDDKYYNWIKINNKSLNDTDFTSWGYPYMLQIEPTNLCNLSCPLCPTGAGKLDRPSCHMPFGMFKGLIDDMERYLLLLVLWDWGEPFMNPELPKMIKYAADKGIKTITSTNAHFYNEAYVEEVLKSGLTTLIVAIDSLDEESYKVYRKEGDLTKSITGLKTILKIKKKVNSNTIINMRMVVMKQNEHEIADLRNLAKELEVDKFTVKTLNPSCGLSAMDNLIPDNPEYRRYQYKDGKRIRKDIQCRRIWGMSNIFSNGDVVPCCYDYNAEMKIGNINEKPFTEIWNSPRYRGLRKMLYYQKDTIPKCKECTINFKLSENGWFIKQEELCVS